MGFSQSSWNVHYEKVCMDVRINWFFNIIYTNLIDCLHILMGIRQYFKFTWKEKEHQLFCMGNYIGKYIKKMQKHRNHIDKYAKVHATAINTNAFFVVLFPSDFKDYIKQWLQICVEEHMRWKDKMRNNGGTEELKRYKTYRNQRTDVNPTFFNMYIKYKWIKLEGRDWQKWIKWSNLIHFNSKILID